MLLSFLLSLCSEVDAFIGLPSFSSFGLALLLAFLVIGPMLDVKNLSNDEELSDQSLYCPIH